MKKRLKKNLINWVVYGTGAFLVLIPFMFNILILKILGVSIIIGFFAQILNDIFQQVRKDNCECKK